MQASSTPSGGLTHKCPAVQIAEALAPPERREYLEVLDDPGVKAAQLIRWVKTKKGKYITLANISTHRRGVCTCH